VIQVDGSVRDRIEVASDISADDLSARALAAPAILALLDGRSLSRVVVRAPKLVNIVLT
jgi:leucyl-tRNA synthetase